MGFGKSHRIAHNYSWPQLLFFFQFLFNEIIMQETCYWPDGSPVRESQGVWQPCHSGPSPCCLSGEACLTNSLCYGSAINLQYRGACNNKAWDGCRSGICDEEIPESWANLWNCALNTTSRYLWCGPESKVRPCDKGSQVHIFTDIAQGILQTILGPSELINSNHAPSTMLSFSNVAGSVTSVAIGTVTVTQQPSLIIQGNSQNSTIKHLKSKNSVAIGIGIAVPLSILFIIFLGIFLWNVRRRKAQASFHSPSKIEDKSPQPATRFSGPRRELIGDLGGIELESRPPIHEM